ncbi:MAG: hypothetical protein ACJKTH_00495 [Patescibacteria group bacterium UBA2163]
MTTSESTLESYQKCRKQVNQLRFARRIALVSTILFTTGATTQAAFGAGAPEDRIPFHEFESLWEEAALAGVLVTGLVSFMLYKANSRKKEACDTWVNVWKRCATTR